MNEELQIAAMKILAIFKTDGWIKVRDKYRSDSKATAILQLVRWRDALLEYNAEAADAKNNSPEGRRYYQGTGRKLVPFPACAAAEFLIAPLPVKRLRDSTPGTDLRAIIMAEAAAGHYAIAFKKVQDSADAAWAKATGFYAHRVGAKIDLYLGKGPNVDISLAGITFGFPFTGYVTAAHDTMDGLKAVQLRTNTKWNARYGENSANRVQTDYLQVPTIVISASGFDPAAKDREALAAIAKVKADRKEEIKAADKAVWAAARVKQTWDELLSYLRFAHSAVYLNNVNHIENRNQLAKQLGLAAVPTEVEARLGKKSAIAAHVKAKEALKALKAKPAESQ